MFEGRGLTFARGERALFEDLDFKLTDGSALRVIGSNGSGKTSLLRIVAGLSRPDLGSLHWCGRIVRGLSPDFLKAINFLGHDDGLKRQLTGLENLAFTLSLMGASVTSTRIEETLEKIGLGEIKHLPVESMSAGQRRRIALARLEFTGHRKLWILDEPFTSLDVKAIQWLAQKLSDHIRLGGILIFTTHQDIDLLSDAAEIRLGLEDV